MFGKHHFVVLAKHALFRQHLLRLLMGIAGLLVLRRRGCFSGDER